MNKLLLTILTLSTSTSCYFYQDDDEILEQQDKIFLANNKDFYDIHEYHEYENEYLRFVNIPQSAPVLFQTEDIYLSDLMTDVYYAISGKKIYFPVNPDAKFNFIKWGKCSSKKPRNGGGWIRNYKIHTKSVDESDLFISDEIQIWKCRDKENRTWETNFLILYHEVFHYLGIGHADNNDTYNIMRAHLNKKYFLDENNKIDYGVLDYSLQMYLPQFKADISIDPLDQDLESITIGSK